MGENKHQPRNLGELAERIKDRSIPFDLLDIVGYGYPAFVTATTMLQDGTYKPSIDQYVNNLVNPEVALTFGIVGLATLAGKALAVSLAEGTGYIYNNYKMTRRSEDPTNSEQ